MVEWLCVCLLQKATGSNPNQSTQLIQGCLNDSCLDGMCFVWWNAERTKELAGGNPGNPIAILRVSFSGGNTEV